MKDVPKMISTKDLSYISDAFNWNFIMAKKCNNYIDLACDEEVKDAIKGCFKLHKDICNKLIDIIEGELK